MVVFEEVVLCGNRPIYIKLSINVQVVLKYKMSINVQNGDRLLVVKVSLLRSRC